MQKQDYESLYDLETSFWWFVGMREITAALLKPFVRTSDRQILDAGCGTGGNLEWLRRYAGTGEVIGVDLEQAGFRVLRATYANSLLLPLAVFRRLVMKRLGLADKGSDVKPLGSKWQRLDTAMKAALRTEALWMDRTGLKIPAGLSAICVAEKPRA
ncbi:MAG: methyltransferase domain-containing protein [Pyrinomonadaceae bacterium]|nr:methyltransferase domain-containing protein [Pyrinomonadaceae bacterium]